MDFYVDIAFAVLLRILKDKKQADKVFSALFKVFKAFLVHYGTHSAVREYMQMVLKDQEES